MHAWRPVWLVIYSLIFFHGCAFIKPQPDMGVTQRPEVCRQFMARLDAAVVDAGVRNAGPAMVPGFPYLRADRFLAAMGAHFPKEKAWDAWVNLMVQKAGHAWETEVMNLPASAVDRLAGETALPLQRRSILEKISECNTALLRHDRTQSDFRQAVSARVRVPAEYATSLRIVGLYPLASLPVAYLTHKARRKFKRWFDSPPADLPVLGTLKAFGPPTIRQSNRPKVRAIIQSVSRNSLNMPLLGEEEKKQVAAGLAPVLEIDVAAPYDIPGKVAWRQGKVSIDTRVPVLYYYFSYAIVDHTPLLQVNYVAWFPARGGAAAPWIERGPLDGLTLRVTLDAAGDPLMLDIMNSCGCYHMFIPRNDRILKKRQKPFAVDAFVPQWLPDAYPMLPLTVRVNSGWHQVQQVAAKPVPREATHEVTRESHTPYALVPYDVLESLPLGNGDRASAFNQRGIMKGSNRVEPFLLFPMGVPSVGSMRQRGHHAISLVGRDHFDDPYLLEKNFEFR